MSELWQLYDEQGRALPGKSAKKDEVFGKGLLHAASHVWMWRKTNGKTEVLLQKRASTKNTWPGRYDISAAGHIDLGEEPLAAALRETQEEIGLTIAAERLQLFGVYRAHMLAENGAIENEFQWLYLLELPGDTAFTLQAAEVASLEWVTLDTFQTQCAGDKYVSHGEEYYNLVLAAIRV